MWYVFDAYIRVLYGIILFHLYNIVYIHDLFTIKCHLVH